MYDPKYKEAYLAHYNHNHDPSTGRFTGNGYSGFTKTEKKIIKKLNKDYKREEKNDSRRNVHYRNQIKVKAQSEISKSKKIESIKNELGKIDDKLDRLWNEQFEILSKHDLYEVDMHDESVPKKVKDDLNECFDKILKLEEKESKLYDNLLTERNKIVDKYLGEYAMATINDLNLSWDPRNREIENFIIRNTMDGWYEGNTVKNVSGSNIYFTSDVTDRMKERTGRAKKYDELRVNRDAAYEYYLEMKFNYGENSKEYIEAKKKYDALENRLRKM